MKKLLPVLVALVACGPNPDPANVDSGIPPRASTATEVDSGPSAPAAPLGLVPADTVSPSEVTDFEWRERSEAESASKFVGAKACRSCHQEMYTKWSKSTHGQAGTDSPAELLPPSSKRTIIFKDAEVSLVRTAEAYEFVVAEKHRDVVRYPVVGVVGGGHIHGGGTQVYWTRSQDGRVLMLPFDYSAGSDTWFCQARGAMGWRPIDQAISLRDCQYPPRRVLGHTKSANCQDCHGSQIQVTFDKEMRAFDTRWTSLGINCESCHGPGGAHVAGDGTQSSMESLALLSKERSVAVCMRCHADKSQAHAGYVMGQKNEGHFATLHLRSPAERKVNLQGQLTKFSYQEGHYWSDCFRNGSMTCVDCHDPHTNAYRDVFGVALEGRFDDGQCTGCHAAKEDSNHGGHRAQETRCTDCHMPMQQHPGIGNKIRYARSDHSVSSPRVNHRGDVGLGCTSCHASEGKEWLRAAMMDLYGSPKPEPPGIAALRAAEKNLEEPPIPPGSMDIPMPTNLPEGAAVEAALRVPSTHRPAVLRALSALVATLPRSERPEVSSELGLRLAEWCRSEDDQVAAAALAASLFLSPYAPRLRGTVLRSLRGLEPGRQAGVRRLMLFNLMAIPYTGSARAQGFGILARDALARYGPWLAEDGVPIGNMLAAAFLNDGDVKEALRWIESSLSSQRYQKPTYALDSAGTFAQSLAQKASIQERSGSLRKAIETLEGAIGQEPGQLGVREQLCVSLLKMGERSKALYCVESLMKRDPDFIAGYFIRAKLLDELRRPQEAVDLLVEGLKRQPENEVARQNLRRLQRQLRGGRAP